MNGFFGRSAFINRAVSAFAGNERQQVVVLFEVAGQSGSAMLV
jgi:hypothetical protein